MIRKDDIKFNYSMNNEALLQLLGEQIKQMRLNKNLTQTELGERSGLSRSAISAMENKGLGTMNSFIQLLRTLEKVEILNHFITEAPVSPIQLAKLRGRARQRASGNRQQDNNQAHSEW
jgi:transcriptional regulator with XRE-family HTH domain